MNRPHRSIEIFTMSALDLFITAMGSFAVLMMVLFPYYKGLRHVRTEELPPSAVSEVPAPVSEVPAPVVEGAAPVASSYKMICVWPTRVQDFEQFAREAGPEFRRHLGAVDKNWHNPPDAHQPNYPATNLSYSQAFEFCNWLTKKEREAGLLGSHDVYQPLSDADWAEIAGPGKYPWGNQWPPPKDAGNFRDELPGYMDRHAKLAPVGSYAPNTRGFYDLAGNVRQWVSSSVDAHLHLAYVMGSSWKDSGDTLLTASRTEPDSRFTAEDTGFRCKLYVYPIYPPAKRALK